MPVRWHGCAVLKARARRVSRQFPVALAWGKHLFPFRTEQLSPTAPMVLGLHGPGRVGRRRFFHPTSRPAGRLVVVKDADRRGAPRAQAPWPPGAVLRAAPRAQAPPAAR